MSVAAIVPAAGLGVRLGPGTPKALRELAGEPVLVHAVRSLSSTGGIDQIVVVVPAGSVVDVRRILTDCGADCGADCDVVAGGATRRESVAAGLHALADEVDVVLVHDAARPLVPAEVVERVLDAVRAGAPAVVPVLPVADTVKRVDDDTVLETVDRTSLRAVQTPQGFARTALQRGHAETTTEATDDAGLVEEVGLPVVVVDGHAEAMKITRPFDVVVAEAILRSR